MKRENRQLTRSELASIASRRPVVRRIPAPGRSDESKNFVPILTYQGAFTVSNKKGG